MTVKSFVTSSTDKAYYIDYSGNQQLVPCSLFWHYGNDPVILGKIIAIFKLKSLK